jgi:signal transduction histidine kinase
MSSISGRMALYVVAVGCAGLGLTFYALGHFPCAGDLAFWLLLVAFVALAALSDRYGLHFAPRTNIHVDTIPFFASLLLFNPAVVLIIAGAGRLMGAIKSRRPAIEVAFNCSQTLAYMGVSALVLNRFTATPWRPEGGAAWLGLLAAASTMYLLNHALVAGIVSLQSRRPFGPLWLSALRSGMVDHTVMFSLGLITALLVESHPWGLILIAVPSVIVFVTLDRTLRMEAQQKRLAEENASLAAWLSTQATQLRQAYSSLEQALEAKNRALQAVLAALRSPLATMASSVGLLSQRLEQLAPGHALLELEALAHSTQEMAQMVEGFLALHALDRRQLQMTEFTVEELLREGLQAVAQRSEEAGVDIYGEYAADIPLLRGDRPRLVLMLSSLLEVAIALSPSGGKIWLEAMPAAEDTVQLIITCHGLALPAEGLSHLLAWPATPLTDLPPELNGHGLGLAVARQIALLHGGRVWAESQGEDKTTFYIALPGLGCSAGIPIPTPG